MRKLAIAALLIVSLLLFASCKTARTYQCEGAATDIRRTNAPERAIEKMLEYIEGEGKNEPCAYIMLFWGYAQMLDFETAMMHYSKALELDPNTREEMENLIQEYEYFLKARQEAARAINAKEFEKALSYAKFAEELEPDHYEAFYIAAECYRLMGRNIEAAEEYYIAIQKLNNMESIGRFTLPNEKTQKTVYYVGSATLADAELYDKALEICDLGLEKFPGYVKVERTRARVLYDMDAPGVEEAYQQLLKDAERNYQQTLDPLMSHTEELYDFITEADPLSVEWHVAFDEYYKILTDPDKEIINLYQKHKEALEDYANALSDAGIYYMTRNEMAFDDLVIAIAYLEKGFFEIDPENKSIVKNLYLTYNKLKYTEDDPKVRAVALKYEELFE